MPAIRRAVRAADPKRRRDDAQWRRLDRAVPRSTVASGPFAGMRLTSNTTGSDIPKRLGSYESELHPLIASWTGYHTILDVGCGEGWYVVGLARQMPSAAVIGFDVSVEAQAACRKMAEANGVTVDVRGLATPWVLADLISGRTLLIVDAEGAEVELLRPDVAPALRTADLLVEMHDFAAPGATAMIRSRFADHRITEVRQTPRRPEDFSALASLDAHDQKRALDESRPSEQTWLWIEKL